MLPLVQTSEKWKRLTDDVQMCCSEQKGYVENRSGDCKGQTRGSFRILFPGSPQNSTQLTSLKHPTDSAAKTITNGILIAFLIVLYSEKVKTYLQRL